MRLFGIITWLFCAGLLQAQSDTVPPPAEFAIITIERPATRILSDAYLYYEFTPGRVFGADEIDTLTFNQRYQNFRYCRVTPKTPSRLTGKPRNTSFKINPVRNHVSDKTSFNLSIRHGVHEKFYMRNIILTPTSFVQYFPEMRPFRNYDWVLEDGADRRTFRREMRFQRWYDLRLYHEEGDAHFTLELKGDSHTVSMTVTPVRNKKWMPSYLVYPEPERLYKQYQRSLSRIERQFNSRLRRSNRLGNTTRVSEFWPRAYFSSEERAMTRQEWLDYYADVVFNEAEYLPDAPYYQSLLVRYLDLNGFTEVHPAWITETRFRLGEAFREQRGIEGVLFINPSANSYYRAYNIQVARDGTFTCLAPNTVSCIAIIELSDGNILVAEQISQDQQGGTFRLPAIPFHTDILTVGALTGYLGL
jgi:hypothetical protein